MSASSPAKRPERGGKLSSYFVLPPQSAVIRLFLKYVYFEPTARPSIFFFLYMFKDAPSPDEKVEEDDDAGTVSSDWSDISGENEATSRLAQKDAGTAASVGRVDPGETDDEPSDAIDLIDDPEIRNAVEDFDSRNWTMEQLEVSCQTLLEECYASEDRRRRLLSAGMLRKLVEIYPSARRWATLLTAADPMVLRSKCHPT